MCVPEDQRQLQGRRFPHPFPHPPRHPGSRMKNAPTASNYFFRLAGFSLARCGVPG